MSRETITVNRITCDMCRTPMGEKQATPQHFLTESKLLLRARGGGEISDTFARMTVAMTQARDNGEYITMCDLCPRCMRALVLDTVRQLMALIQDAPQEGAEANPAARAIRIPEVAVASAEENP